jgi:NosR/NirI family transcriptional regulator, nitrous oxide reductase regulator
MDSAARRRLKTWAVHLVRVGLLAAIFAVIHFQNLRMVASQRARSLASLSLAQLRAFFPAADRLGAAESHGGRVVLDVEGRELGYVIQTSPESDQYLGFSGPTNCLVAFSRDRILGATILGSRDTRDHVELIQRDRRFLTSWNGLTWDDAAGRTEVDGVAGATLTSLAIVQGLQQRLGGSSRSLKFPEPVTLAEARKLFPEAARVAADSAIGPLWHVWDPADRPIGSILRTSPAADEVVGYQGPTEALIAIRANGQICGIAVGGSFDNEPYVTYVRDDEYFRTLFNDHTLSQLGELDLEQSRIEGVSGATMTSLAVARGLIQAAQAHEAALARRSQQQAAGWTTRWRAAATLVIVIFGLVLGITSLKGVMWLRVAFQVVLIAYLGLASGDLLSLAMFVGWSQSGIPWQNALGLIILAGAAIIVPIARGQNVYCSHLCPHGAAQQLLPRRWRLRRGLPPWLGRTLRLIRPLLLAWAMLVALCHWPFSLVDIEPFDAYSWRAAAWPTIAVAILGLIASLFVPMAYCRYGCPTGAALEYLRRHSKGDRLTRADAFSAGCLLLAIVLLTAYNPAAAR